jgi:hypothetical protein
VWCDLKLSEVVAERGTRKFGVWEGRRGKEKELGWEGGFIWEKDDQHVRDALRVSLGR